MCIRDSYSPSKKWWTWRSGIPKSQWLNHIFSLTSHLQESHFFLNYQHFLFVHFFVVVTIKLTEKFLELINVLNFDSFGLLVFWNNIQSGKPALNTTIKTSTKLTGFGTNYNWEAKRTKSESSFLATSMLPCYKIKHKNNTKTTLPKFTCSAVSQYRICHQGGYNFSKFSHF